MYITLGYGKMLGGPPTFLICGNFSKMGVFQNEQFTGHY